MEMIQGRKPVGPIEKPRTGLNRNQINVMNQGPDQVYFKNGTESFKIQYFGMGKTYKCV